MINSYTSWQPLEAVIVGRAYTPDYFDFITNTQVRQQLQQILFETVEDLDNLQQTIERYGATVYRPGLPNKDQFIKNQIAGCVPIPPLTPRDWQITLGQKLLRIIPVPELNSVCDLFKDQIVNPHFGPWNPGCILNNASASCIVRVGCDVFLTTVIFYAQNKAAGLQKMYWVQNTEYTKLSQTDTAMRCLLFSSLV